MRLLKCIECNHVITHAKGDYFTSLASCAAAFTGSKPFDETGFGVEAEG